MSIPTSPRPHVTGSPQPWCSAVSSPWCSPQATHWLSHRIGKPPRRASRTTYQAYLPADCLTGSNFCKFVSAGRAGDGGLLEIHRVACQGWHTSALASIIRGHRRAANRAPTQFVGRIDFLETSYAPANGGSVWAISEQTLMFIPAGHRLQVTLNSGTTGVGSYGCTISGYLTAG